MRFSWIFKKKQRTFSTVKVYLKLAKALEHPTEKIQFIFSVVTPFNVHAHIYMNEWMNKWVFSIVCLMQFKGKWKSGFFHFNCSNNKCNWICEFLFPNLYIRWVNFFVCACVITHFLDGVLHKTLSVKNKAHIHIFHGI